jgi:hypothetical protein
VRVFVPHAPPNQGVALARTTGLATPHLWFAIVPQLVFDSMA